ncbi:MAG: acyltransferase [Pseudomonadota bacterium]
MRIGAPETPALLAMQTIHAIQYLRAVAAILVVLLHNSIEIRDFNTGFPVFHDGAFGVDIFFVISGFIMWTISTMRPQTPLRFLENRIIRIVPIYWLLTIVTVLVSTDGGLSIAADIDWGRALRSLFFIPEWHPTYPMAAPVMFVGWTLNLEMAFYLLFALALFLPPRWRLPTMLFVLCAFASARLVIGEPQQAALNLYTYSVVGEFGLGMLLGSVYGHRTMLGRGGNAHIFGPSAVLLGLGILASKAIMPEARILYYGLPALLIVCGVLLWEPIIARRPLPLLIMLGDASYSIYLTHIMALAISQKLIGAWLAADWPFVALFAQTLFAVIVGVVVHLAVEKPLTAGAKKLVSRPTQRTSFPRSARASNLRTSDRRYFDPATLQTTRDS